MTRTHALSVAGGAAVAVSGSVYMLPGGRRVARPRAARRGAADPSRRAHLRPVAGIIDRGPGELLHHYMGTGTLKGIRPVRRRPRQAPTRRRHRCSTSKRPQRSLVIVLYEERPASQVVKCPRDRSRRDVQPLDEVLVVVLQPNGAEADGGVDRRSGIGCVRRVDAAGGDADSVDLTEAPQPDSSIRDIERPSPACSGVKDSQSTPCRSSDQPEAILTSTDDCR